jgi:hypothetical protein
MAENTTHRVKKGETAKILTVTLKHTDDTNQKVPYPIPDGSTVRIYMTLNDDTTLKVSGSAMTILDQSAKPGKAQYKWLSNNIDTPDVYDLEVEVTLPDDSKLKWPCEEGETFATVIVLPSKS